MNRYILYVFLLLFLIIVLAIIYICIFKNEDYTILNYLPEPYVPFNYTTSLPNYVKENVPDLFFSNNKSLMLIRAVDDIRFNYIRIICAVLRKYDKKIEVKINDNVVNHKLVYYGSMHIMHRDFPLKYANIIIPLHPNVTSVKVNEIKIPYSHIKEIKYKYDFTVCINTDIDEIIMPTMKYNKLSELISIYEDKYKKCKLFLFLNKIFPKKLDYIDKLQKKNRDSYFYVNPVADCDIFNLTLSCKPTEHSRKYIVRTELVEALRIHNIDGNERNYCFISDKDGFSHHTRYIPLGMINECKKLSHDYTILKYK